MSLFDSQRDTDVPHLMITILRQARRKVFVLRLLVELDSCFAGHPEYTVPESATSPEASSVCSHNILLSSMEAPESSREPGRMAQLEAVI